MVFACIWLTVLETPLVLESAIANTKARQLFRIEFIFFILGLSVICYSVLQMWFRILPRGLRLFMLQIFSDLLMTDYFSSLTVSLANDFHLPKRLSSLKAIAEGRLGTFFSYCLGWFFLISSDSLWIQQLFWKEEVIFCLFVLEKEDMTLVEAVVT